MLSLSHTVDVGNGVDPWRLFLIADTHLGNAHCDEALIHEVIHRIEEDDRALWVHLGDICEYITRRDSRYDEQEYAQWLWGVGDVAAAQRDYAVRMFQPIGGKLVAACEGNHEASIYQHNDREVYKTWAEAVTGGKRRVCLGHAGFLRVRYQLHYAKSRGSTFTLSLYLSHGSGGGRTPSAPALRLRDMASNVEGADVVAMGHHHKAALLHQRKRRPGRSKAKDVSVWWMAVPSFLRDARYAEDRDLPPQGAGWGVVTVLPQMRVIRAMNEVR